MIRKTSNTPPAASLRPPASAIKTSQALAATSSPAASSAPPGTKDRAQIPAAARQEPVIVSLNDDEPAPALADVRQGKALIKPGMEGPAVSDVQRLLTEKGYGVQVTGTLGPTTQSVLERFQKDRHLGVDGVVGKNTLLALESKAPAVSQEVDSLKRFVSRGRVSARNLPALGNGIDALLTKPDVRAALIERYGLNSAENKKALVAVTAIESGDNGDMGEVMTTVINRALSQNIVREITGIGGKTSISNVVNDGNQFASRSGFNRIMKGGDTGQRHFANFKGDAEKVLAQVIEGKHTFKHNASNIFYFDQGGARHQFRVGVHRFREGYMGKSQHFSQEFLQQQKRINW